MKKNLLILAALTLSCASLVSCNSSSKSVGVLKIGSFDALNNAENGFVKGLENAGFVNGKNITLKSDNANGDGATDTAMAQALASSCDMVLGISTTSATALKAAVDAVGNAIPVLFTAATDPVGAGLIASMEKPGGNVTGTSDLGPIEAEINLLKNFTSIDTVAFLYTQSESNSVVQLKIAQPLIEKAGWTFVSKPITAANEITSAVSSLSADVDAVLIPTDNTIAENMANVKAGNEARTGHPLIVAGCDSGMIDGAVIAMGVDYYKLGLQTGAMAAKILNGAKPADVPAEYNTDAVIKVNKTWATSLGLEIPAAITSTEGAEII
jgi:putative ABC transport system substrate-binding protein